MPSSNDPRTILVKLAHDLRNPVNTAQLNLEAAEMIAAKLTEAKAQRLATHLRIVAGELQKLKECVVKAAEQLQEPAKKQF
jgi:signal transduction histidine kinase